MGASCSTARRTCAMPSIRNEPSSSRYLRWRSFLRRRTSGFEVLVITSRSIRVRRERDPGRRSRSVRLRPSLRSRRLRRRAP